MREEHRRQLEELATAVDRKSADASFRAMLDGTARIWRYSAFNQLLIHFQSPDATSVHGRATWEVAGRPPRKRAKPIWIWAPRSAAAPWPPVAVKVYDIAQTRGPKEVRPRHLDGEAPALDALLSAVPFLGVELRWIDPQPAVSGATMLAASHQGWVEVTRGLSQLETALGLAHELGHELLHTDRRAAGWCEGESVREAEAHSTAYLVLRALGLPCDAAGYLVWRGGDGRQPVAELEAHHVIGSHHPQRVLG